VLAVLAVLAVHLVQAVSSRDSCAGCKSSIVLRVCCALNTVTQPTLVKLRLFSEFNPFQHLLANTKTLSANTE
jgi:hypothetical protein